MPPRFLLACATCVLYDAWGLKYEKHHNRGIGPMLFASICIMAAGFEVAGVPDGDQLITASLIAWSGFLLGMVLYYLFSSEDKSGCVWLIISPLTIALIGLPMLGKGSPARDSLRALRTATGLSAIGILLGHFLGRRP